MTHTIPAPRLRHAAGDSGPPIVLVHGFGADRLSWLANTAELGKVGQVYTLDLPGHGGTPLGGPADIGTFAAALGRSIDEAGIAPVHLVGHSLGGALALTLASERPELVRSLALIAPVGLGGPVSDAFLTDFPKIETAEGAADVMQRLVSRPRLINRHMVALVLEQLAVPGVREGLSAIADTLRDVEAGMAPHVAAVAASEIPRLVIWGDADTTVPLIADRLEPFGAEQLIVEGAAHLPHVENARAVNERLVAWLAAQDQRSSAP